MTATAEHVATQEQVLEALLGRGRREFVPLSRAFVQQPRPGGGPGPLADFVRNRRKRALQLYLLTHAVASSPPWDVTLAADVWARALGMAANRSSAVQISATFKWIESQRLIESRRAGRLRSVRLLADDGSGRPYEHPGSPRRGKATGYLKLPHAYWSDGWHKELDLAATTVLLIGLSLPDGFALPQQQAASWYGLSRDTLRRGIAGLHAHRLLAYRKVRKAAPLAPGGFTMDRRYTLLGPFSSSKRSSSRSTH